MVSVAKWSIWSVRAVAEILLVALLYFVGAKIALSGAFYHDSVFPIWPSAGVSLAAFLVLGYRTWPGVFIGAFLSNDLLITGAGPLNSLIISAGNVVEASLGAWFIKRYMSNRMYLDRAWDVVRFVMVSGFLCSAVSATVGAFALCWGGAFAGVSSGNFGSLGGRATRLEFSS
jgi:integral membrane sensor domain MASE1